MRQHAFCLTLLILLSVPLSAQHEHGGMKMEVPALDPGMGSLHHAVSTRNADAQKFFDQGLTYVYAFNHDEAVRSFSHAADLDPSLAIAFWGVALALGPNINLDVDPEREQMAYNAVQAAKKLAGSAPEQERAYIDALSRRYSNDPRADLKKLAADYSMAMGELAKRYPDDLDAQVLYAESLMDLRPWALWTSDGKPAEGTEEIISVLEGVLKRDPMHVGANHYYIHTIEAGPHPERALPSARRLETLVPAAGHLVHMPAHIYMRTGNFIAAIAANEAGAAADRQYIRRHGAEGIYPMMYYNHNLSFLSAAQSMAGNYAGAKKSADEMVANMIPIVRQMPMVEPFLATADLVQVRFRRWDEILRSAEPHFGPTSNAFWHFARGMALTARGSIPEASKELALVRTAARAVVGEATFLLNSNASLLTVAESVLEAEIAMAKGDRKGGISLLRKAVELQDGLTYNEPPDWFFPVRESLGAALLLDGQSRDAEAVFRRDLEINPGNGRSLFGLAESLRKQKREWEASLVDSQFRKAWAVADTKLRIEDL